MYEDNLRDSLNEYLQFDYGVVIPFKTHHWRFYHLIQFSNSPLKHSFLFGDHVVLFMELDKCVTLKSPV
jgi:hypothetical protein